MKIPLFGGCGALGVWAILVDNDVLFSERAMESSLTTTQTPERLMIGRPPIPREHGAWVILYAPLVIGLAVAGRFEPVPTLLLALAVTGAYLARHAADLVLRRREQPGTRFWLGAFAAAFVAGGLPLIVAWHRTGLLWVGGAVGVLFSVHAGLTLRPARKRFDRTAAGELLAVAALVATGPAATIAVRGSLDSLAVSLWLLCALFFGSGVLHVNMYLDAAKMRGAFGPTERAQVSRPTLFYHIAFCVVFPLAAFVSLGGGIATFVAVAGVLPAIVRAFAGIATVSTTLPPLKRVGWQESANALWFSACLIAAFLLR